MITVVTGPPCSGKTTYIAQHAQPGDIVIDYDVIAQALGSQSTHNHSGPMRHVVKQARRAAINAALTVHDRVPVWIAETTISPADLYGYEKAGAMVVSLGASKDELHRRAARERPAVWHRLIEAWKPSVNGDSSSRQW